MATRTRRTPVRGVREAAPAGWASLGRWPATVFDLIIATVIVTLTANDHPWAPDLVFGLVMGMALLQRRSRPEAVFVLVSGLAAIQILLSPSAPAPYDCAVLVAMIAVVSHASRLWTAYLAGAVVLVGQILMAARAGLLDFSTDQSGQGDLVLSVTGFGLVAASWLIALVLRTRRLLVATLRERAATAERERDHLNLLAAADERAAIARELHDVVAHSLAVMILQADGASYVVIADSVKAQAAMRTIADTGREALADMHGIVDVLRGASAGAGPEPQRHPVGLEQLHPLLERAESAGLRVTLTMDKDLPMLTAAEQLTIVRLVQESLTNVLRHAGPGAEVRVGLTFTADAATIEVSDNGMRGLAAGPDRPGVGRPHGSGLIGMRERVSAHRGAFSAGPNLDGGWTMRAVIPVRRAG
jgi:signal transduction histidine kinase